MTVSREGFLEALGLVRFRADARWTGVLADFDARVFSSREAWPRWMWREILDDGGCVCLVYALPSRGLQARGDVVAAGCVALRAVGEPVRGDAGGGDAEILTLGVAPGWRGRGAGGILLDDLLGHVPRGRAVRLAVREGNEAARGLYDSRGFVSVGRIRRYFGREDGIAMRRDGRD